MFVDLVDPDVLLIEEAARVDDFPRDCMVCWFEHGRRVAAGTAAEALEHRRTAHRWLHDWLVSRGLVP